MTLAGFDGFQIQRSDKTALFLGDGYSSDDGNISLPRGSLLVLAHKGKEIKKALEIAGAQPTEAEVARKVALMSQKEMYRPGIDVTQAELVSRLNWRRQERTEMVGNCKAKVYDMLHVMFSLKSRRVPGVMIDEERMVNGAENSDYDHVLTAEERAQLESALRMGNADGLEDDDHGMDGCHENGTAGAHENCESNGAHKKKKSWFGWKKGAKSGTDDPDDTKISKNFLKLAPEASNQKSMDHQKASSELAREDFVDTKKGKEKISKKKKKKVANGESKHESDKVANGESKQYKKGLTPVLWLAPDFPLKIDELLPLLDILANKVKAIQRIRELLTTKLPSGTFPVKIAIPIVPTIRVVVTLTNFNELQPLEEFSTPLSSPPHFQDVKPKESEGSMSWISWMRGGQSSDGDGHRHEDDFDPFHIPSDYTWVDAKEERCPTKTKKAKRRKHKKAAAARSGDVGAS